MALPQSQFGEWFILRERKHEGPFTYQEMIQMQQQKALYDFDFVWTHGMKAWMPLAHLAEFSPGRLEILANDNESKVAFERRRGPRVHFEVPLYVHNDSYLWRGKTITVSKHGAMLLMDNPMLLPRQVINLHFRKHARNPEEFIVIGEIIAKKLGYLKRSADGCVKYAVKYIKTTGSAEQSFDNWIAQQTVGGV